jgi:hypothetical protein
MRVAFVLSVSLAFATACGPADRTSPSVDGGARDTVDCSAPTAEICGSGLDEDCDGKTDCADEDCDGEGDCSSCGQLDLTESQPLALPDGDGASYETSIDITGFSSGQTSTAASDFLGICVVMEHSWLRDLQIELTCPSGQKIVMSKFLGRDFVQAVFMGEPNDEDTTNPIPGIGAEYCWSPTATRPPMLTWAAANGSEYETVRLPPGDYSSVDPFDNLVGCTLNGTWTIKVTDLWPIDNGFIFSWGVKFDPDIVEDCSGWPVE